MPNLVATLNDHFRRVARREARGQVRVARHAGAKFRRDIAALKRLVKNLQSRLAYLEKKTRTTGPQMPAAASLENVRFRADGLRTHRSKLGLSAKDYGKLVGVSALTIYNWEAGKSRPRKKQLATLIPVRGLGKREAGKRLAEVA